MDPKTLLLISPRCDFNRKMSQLLAENGVRVVQAEEKRICLAIEEERPHLVLYDGYSAEHSGLIACQKIRAAYQGLLICLMHDSVVQLRVLALSLGADLTLSCSDALDLIAAQVQALLRRFDSGTVVVRRFGDLLIDTNRRDAFVAGQPAELSTLEFDLLWSLVCKAGVVVSREDLYTDLYGASYNGYDRSIDMHISHIRKKIGDDSLRPFLLKTVRGVGYQFINNPEESPRRLSDDTSRSENSEV